MQLKLEGKSALVSGATKGIGFAIAKQLAAEGTRVVVNGRTEDAVKSALAQIRQTVPSAKVDGFAGDL
jgi:NAD(P)-dependent dehydrogenase (short-subunit alcohol dehydrogenase family)